MKKIFEEASLEVITFETNDIVTASPGIDGTEPDPFSLYSAAKSASSKSYADKSWSFKR